MRSESKRREERMGEEKFRVESSQMPVTTVHRFFMEANAKAVIPPLVRQSSVAEGRR